MLIDLLSLLVEVLAAACIALACLLLVTAWQARQARPVDSLFQPEPQSTSFLFDGDRLVDATPSARALIADGDGPRPWAQLMARLGPMFPDLAREVSGLSLAGRVLLPSAPGVKPPVVLQGEHLCGLTRLSLVPADGGSPGDVASLAALQDEVRVQRTVLARAPVLIWKEDPQGAVIWANHAYLLRAAELLPKDEDLSWPLPKLFSNPDQAGRSPQRISLSMRGGTEWFDLIRFPSEDEVLNYALAANAAVEAESTLRDFMQTLAKTFADLPIGLAIFDRSRILQLFNPALADLTALPPDFLISRPTLAAVLDAMRAKAMIPEPKDYRSWRKQVMRVEEEASSGHFEETWNLPGGQTYRVIGRPHPNGALAFMFEDISTEMSRTRRYRADMELGQSVIDAVGEAVAVFSQGGQLVMSNLAYARLWNHDPQVMLSDAGIGTLCTWWRDHSAPTLLWDDATDFVTTLDERAAWDGEARLLDGRLIAARFRPLAGGATLITFSPRPAAGPGPVLDSVASDRLQA